MEKERINVFYNCSKAYIKYLYVSLFSLFNSNRDYYIVVFIGTFDLNIETCHDIIELALEFDNEIVLCKCDKEEFVKSIRKLDPSGFLQEIWKRTGYEALIVYKMFELIPDDIDRIIRLHVDTIIKSSLRELYFIELDKYDTVSPLANYCFQEDYSYNNKKNGKSGAISEFFCAYNLMNINKNELSLEYILGRFNDITREEILIEDIKAQLAGCYDYLLTCAVNGRMGFCDGLKYNYYSMETKTKTWNIEDRLRARRSSIVVHYDGYNPWDGKNKRLPLDSLWWEMAKFSPYYMEFVRSYRKSKVYEIIYNNSFLYWRDNYKDKKWQINRLGYLILAFVFTTIGCGIFEGLIEQRLLFFIGMIIIMEPFMGLMRHIKGGKENKSWE